MSTINRALRTSASFLLVFLVTGCSSLGGDGSRDGGPDEEKKPVLVDAHKVCDGLLGQAGGDALVELTQDRRVISRGLGDVGKVVRQMKSASATSGSGARLGNICSFKAPTKGVDSQSVEFSYGWGAVPEKVPKRRLISSAGAAFVTRDVDRIAPTVLYFRCARESEPEGVVKGEFTGNWDLNGLSAPEEDRNHIRVALASASAMSDALGCANDPDLSPGAEPKLLNGDAKPSDPPSPFPELPE
ncbi:hypothetical protein [Streptomyces daliensis]|uniref:Lipoprotein n=1 Tax=Streptomyces daliensis TaxID=299421 RepID=A0A8T4IHX2_9ACTN|nr:hypothetical protein [Streptomyces daliensis]